MTGNQYIFQVSGIKTLQMKGELLQGIKRLGGKYLGGSKYKEEITHLVVINPLASEKFIAACAGGKWIVTPKYVLDSAEHGAWLPEASYELDLMANKAHGFTNPLLRWRENICSGTMSGAFQGWVVRLELDDPARKGMFERILRAGKAMLWTDESNTQAVTHVFTKDRTKTSTCLPTPYHTVSYIAEHLFGPVCSSLDWSINVDTLSYSASSVQTQTPRATSEKTEDEPTDDDDHLILLELEEKLKSYITKMELQRRVLLKVPELFRYYTPALPAQVTAVDFSNVCSLVECGLFPQALEEVQGSLKPGLLPPALLVQACMQHALQAEVQPYYLSVFSSVLNDILRNNPTWGSPKRVAYFLQILQCPQCKNSAWSLLQTSVRFCMASTDTCHPQPSHAPTELRRFHSNLQAFFLLLFRLELHAAGSGAEGSRASVLSSAFWTVWEKSTLSSRAMQQLAKLLVEASLWALHSNQEWRLRVLATLQEILAVTVEYWAQENSELNGRLVEKGFQDLAEYMAILCQDLRLDCLQELVPGLASPRLRMFTADALYRNLSCRTGVSLRPEPLSLLKIVSSYLKTLGRLCGCKHEQTLETRPETSSSTGSDSLLSGVEERQHVGVSSFGKENLPRGFHRVNAAGETLLHRACKRNQVKTVLCVLSLPGTDVNVKDYAGWTPLHEACNHGSIECVHALLQHCPGLQLDSQVEGVSPLHDALVNQHTHIAKMLLRHAGSALLQVRDNYGRTPLDLAPSPEVREELRRCACEGDSRESLEALGTDVRDLSLIETCSCLLSSLLLSYLQEHHILSCDAPDPPLDLGPSKARALMSLNPGVVASLWGDSEAVSLAKDLRTLMNMELYVPHASPALRQCQGPHTSLFLHLLFDLQDEGSALRSGQPVQTLTSLPSAGPLS
ncbi:SMC5-SMC6 complex localization factor protein 1 isoform X2 [Electrophorus electricus]|uniref:SMC5-SMC6 complex localization factor protein 1 isoform X2 n=1 Tax=Electrophorus electricus TaxID=8005 RepID=UPI0015D0258B|nr:SMC5-SMC6 complex localization factor protein 1 isoform X2 [Electrophorus electricus]